ncbi:MAG: response regulator [Gemmatimonadales bacterium]|nr:MAG: response regulator [Gemmatimonadales bacterium]
MAKSRILIAEDEPHLREVLHIQLELAGFEVIEACDGEEVLELAQHVRPDVILLDVMMPRKDGYEALKSLRASYATRFIPIIMLTAKDTKEDVLNGVQGGANDYLTKPYDRSELMLRINNQLSWSRQQREANPLTGLPGNLSINRETERRLGSGEPFALLQVDIDFFKAYNDHYGYPRGDEAIQTLSRILVDAASHHGEGNFVGHIGGDDFVLLSTPEHAKALGQEIIDAFSSAAPSLYDAEDRERGYVEVKNRRDELEHFPLMTVTIALVSTDRAQVSHLAQLTDIAQELKAHGKGIPGSVLVGERRHAETRTPDAERHAA